MRILHTSDLHLQEPGDERWNALQRIMEVCEDEDVDILAICGDLFDQNPEMDELRLQLPELFTGNEFEILIIPGNHDKEVCDDMYFGGNGKLLTDPSTPEDYLDGKVRVIGLPYEKLEKEEVLEKLTSLDTFSNDMTNILLYHGELLDAFFSPESYGDEGGKREMSLKLSYFNDLPIDYVLAGHFHKSFDVWLLNNGGFFVYSGAPVPIKRNEVGKRKVNIFEVGKKPSPHELDVPFYSLIDVELNPLGNGDPLTEIEGALDEMEPNAVPVLNIHGYINGRKIGLTETEFVKRVKKMAREKSYTGKVVEKSISVLDIRRVLENDLFDEFKGKLEEKDHSEGRKEEILRGVIRSMMKAGL